MDEPQRIPVFAESGRTERSELLLMSSASIGSRYPALKEQRVHMKHIWELRWYRAEASLLYEDAFLLASIKEKP